jgi:hypothetical protein
MERLRTLAVIQVRSEPRSASNRAALFQSFRKQSWTTSSARPASPSTR